ncbi:hypothetical protein OPQ81_000760 [Rhizoctonia solani]|nr:hypothetical protein OPQ81_000760 [Rhizoctonia solani]
MVPQKFYTIKHKLFPSFEPKRYHLQFRHAALVTLLLICASFALPAYHQRVNFVDSIDYSDSPDLPTKSSYNRIHRYVNEILYYNEAVALWMIAYLAAEGLFQRSAPVWCELTWLSVVLVGEVVCLALMASSRPEACDYDFGVDDTRPEDGKLSPINTITSICSNWRGMTGMLVALVWFFALHLIWHIIIAVLPSSASSPNFPPTDVEKAAAKEKQLETLSAEYTSRGTDSLSFPLTPTSEEYSNFSRLPVNPKPVVLVQSSVTKSDTSSIVEEIDSSPKAQAPFSYDSK